jgi:Zn-finger nucleic acid-binding protein
MMCPTCKTTKLSITERKGIEIDFCPDCRGIWLDRGELDKILERSREEVNMHARDEDSIRPTHEQKHSGYSNKPYYKKKKSFLEELFD